MNLYVFSTNSAHSDNKTIKYIEHELKRFIPDIVAISFDNLDMIELSDVHILIFSGGDGIFNRIINKCYYYNITFGYIPTGTANDMGRNLGINNIETALNVIKSRNVREINLLECNTDSRTIHFLYALSIGRMSNIPNKAKKEKKRLFGKFIYVLRGCLYLFSRKDKISYNLNYEDFEQKVKCLIITRSMFLGGQRIDKDYSNLLKIYIVRNVIDLGKIFILKNYRARVISKFEAKFKTPVSIDGEKIETNTCEVKISDSKIKIFY